MHQILLFLLSTTFYSNYPAPNTASAAAAYPYHANPVSLPPPSTTAATTTSATATHLAPPSVPTSTSYSQYHRSGGTSHTDYRHHPYSSSSTSSGGDYYKPYSSSSSSHSYGGSRYSQSTSNLDRDRGSSRYGSSTHSYSRSASNLHSSSGHGKKTKPPRNEFGIPYGQPGAGLTKPDWANIQLPKFQKNFYREAPAISSMTDQDVIDWRKKYDIVVTGHNVPRPIRSFQEAGFPPYIMAEINRAGFRAPTAIQSQGWPMAMSGRDVIGIAETGSGKTLAFLLPCIVHINAQPLLRDGDGPIVLVIAPTHK